MTATKSEPQEFYRQSGIISHIYFRERPLASAEGDRTAGVTIRDRFKSISIPKKRRSHKRVKQANRIPYYRLHSA